MMSREGDWAPGNFANHLWWHTSLFHLDLGQYNRVLEIYDEKLRSTTPPATSTKSWTPRRCCGGSSCSTSTSATAGASWPTAGRPSATDTLYAFNDVHAMMTFVSDGRDEEAQVILNATERYLSTPTTPTSR